ncbi:hypothetical protein [Aestuariivita sp.]|jgi:hypothetical protein|nr:hypothetical protein [Aestuariivita sp.]MCE8006426.1 hypothetical protein [Aestuariivita sp.]
MKRFTLVINLADEGLVQHITKAESVDAAIARIRRAYPAKDIQFLSVTG